MKIKTWRMNELPTVIIITIKLDSGKTISIELEKSKNPELKKKHD